MKISELISPALDWAVAKCEGRLSHDWTYSTQYGHTGVSVALYCSSLAKAHAARFSPSEDWFSGGPIIDREEITIDYRDNETQARKWSNEKNHFIVAYAGKKQGLLAAMRCFVASRLGEEIEIPEELLK